MLLSPRLGRVHRRGPRDRRCRRPQVAGINHKLKLKTGDSSCVHVVLYDQFGTVSVTSVDKDVSLDTPL